MARRTAYRYALILALILAFSGQAHPVPDSTMSISPTATSGTTITAADENARNSAVSSTFNAHSHNDISTMTGINSFTIGDGAAGNKSYAVNDDQGANPALRFNTTLDQWEMSNDGSTFSAVQIVSGSVIAGENTFRIGDGTDTGNKDLIFNELTADSTLRWNTSGNNLEFSASGGTFNDVMVPGTMTNGQLLIGDGDDVPTIASLTAGSGITVTPGAGSITLAATRGAWIFVETLNTTSGASVTSATLPTSSDEFMVVFENVRASTGAVFGFRPNSDATADKDVIAINTATITSTTGQTSIQLGTLGAGASDHPANGVMYVPRLSQGTDLLCTGTVTMQEGGVPRIFLYGNWNGSATTVTTLNFILSAGAFTAGEIRIYRSAQD